MMSGLSSLKSNPKNEKDGVWYEPADGVRFKLKRAGGSNKEYNKTLAKLMKPYANLVNTKKKDDIDHLKIVSEAIIKTCLVDWEGFPEVEKEYTPELALEELMKEEWFDLMNMIADFCGTPGNFKNEQELEDLGKS